ncbi:hypothetical protein VB713_00250 [Anabaena cylindrica UHCC 0172]|uniref:hypothetical protein n=1 Tax=Anabaena cylindrica TaxID=1165 RepID=UPI002B203181|nr:hypothetical protein [Anabaena cylindrica]MEA5549423.1 hypothetical protein [Anabaena cylindrica UHCC 0172]
MLKIRTFFLALACAPLISLCLQLTNQVQASSPSKGQAGSGSGGATPPTNYHPGQSPSKGQAGSGSGGATPPTNHPGQSPSKGQAGSGSGGGNTNNPGQSPSKGQAGSGSGANSSNIIITKELDGSIKITLLPDAVKRLNYIAAKLRASGKYSRFTRFKAILLQKYFVLNGLHPQLAKSFTSVLPDIFLTSSDASTAPSLPSVQLPQAKLIASIKAFKAGLTIAEANEVPTVNVDKLNEAINIHNKIVLESDPATLQQLLRNSDFVEIGKALTELRAAIQ